MGLYQLNATVGNVDYTRNDVLFSDAMSHERSYFPAPDPNGFGYLGTGSLTARTTAQGLVGFPSAGESRLRLSGRLDAVAGDSVPMGMPQDLTQWAATQNMRLSISYVGSDGLGYGEFTCTITQFDVVP